ncbi:MarR family winged helix-turn-helix transcriptional regulator [Roseibium sp.]|uniref:MarR family winged helix-turn-helix transcriptional regulator n=1 Tax=Roseibium sp. TaxID=1936156 RepID=UPI003A9793EC
MSETTIEEAGNASVCLGHLASDLSFATRALRARLRHENAEFYQSHGVEAGGIAILSLIGLNPGISQKELAGAIVLKKSAMTKVINHMEAQGLIERRKGAVDKRVNALFLTKTGTQHYKSMMSDMLDRQDKLLAPLSAAERALFFEMMWRLINQFEGVADGE